MDAPKMLREWRGNRTLREAADLVGCDPSYLSLLENRKKKPVDRILSLQLKRVAGIPPEAWDDEDPQLTSLDDTLTAVKIQPDDSRSSSEGEKKISDGGPVCLGKRPPNDEEPAP